MNDPPSGPELAPYPPAEQARAIRARQRYLTFFILLLAAWISRSFLTPVAWAAVLAASLWPLYRRMLERGPSHPTAAALVLTLGTGLVVMLPLALAIGAAAQESQTALQWLGQAQRTGLPPPPWLASLPLIGARANGAWQQHVGSPQAANNLIQGLNAGAVFGWTRTIGGEVARGSMLFLITLLALFGMLRQGDRLGAQAEAVATRVLGTFGGQFLERLAAAVRGTVSGTVLVSVAEGSLIGLGYWIAGVPRPLLFAILTIAFAMVPFGAWIAFGVATAILLVQGHVVAGALLFAFSVVVMTVGDNVVQPRVIGSAVRLPFLLALVGTFGGLETFGLVGLFLGPVIMAALMLAWQQWLGSAEAPGASAEASVQPDGRNPVGTRA
jgi:predicted PurR-regulated permease PerM